MKTLSKERNYLKVTILIPAKDLDFKLLTAVQSIRLDEFSRDTPIVIVFDGGKFDSEIKKLLHSFDVKLVKNPGPNGVANSLNYGLGFVDTEIIRRFDADDIWMAGEQVSTWFYKNPNLSVITGRSISFSNNWKLFRFSLPTFQNFQVQAQDFISGNIVSHPASYIRKSHLESVGGYSTFCPAEDFLLWLKLKDAGFEINYRSYPYVLYRRHDNQLSKHLNSNEIAFSIFKEWNRAFLDKYEFNVDFLEYLLCRAGDCHHDLNSTKSYINYLNQILISDFWSDFTKNQRHVHFIRLLIPLLIHSRWSFTKFALGNPFLALKSLRGALMSSVVNYFFAIRSLWKLKNFI